MINEDKMLSYFHHLAQARQYADTEGQKLIEQELKRIKAKYGNDKKKLAVGGVI